MRMRILDGVAIVVSAAVIGAFSWYAYGHAGEEPMVYIQGESSSWVYPLGADREVGIPGPLGTTRVHIEGGSVHVTDSPCRDKICIYAGTISRKGDWIACLPNRVLIRIESRTEVEVDATVF